MMKNRLLYNIILGSALLLSSCTAELSQRELGSDGKVTVCFDAVLPLSGAMTKSLGDDAAVKNLYVAVFDAGGYLVEYVPAKFLSVSTVDGETTYSDATATDGVYTANEGIYTFQVELTTSNESRSLNFIANSPATTMEWGSEIERMTSLVTSGDNDAYWQRIVLSDGIVEDASVMRTRLGGTITLVRNFAKVSISSATNFFKLESAKLYNVPDCGCVAAYTPSSGFIAGYQEHDYEWASSEANYGGYLPGAAKLVSSFGEDDFKVADDDGVSTDYIFERPAPDSSPVFAILKGKYNNGSTYQGLTRYYKVLLCDDDGNYYPFLRNYNYKVKVKTVKMEGFSTLSEALQSAGNGGDISTNMIYSDLTEITGEKSRIIVSETTVDVVGSKTVELWFKYQPDVTSSEIDNSKVSYTVGAEGTYGAAISDTPTLASTDEADGSRKITLTTTDSDPTYIKSQTLTLVGDNGSGEKLQRVITINVHPLEDLKLKCTKRVPSKSGSTVNLQIGIPGGLPESMFPLEFKIESDKSSLMPALTEQLPTEAGQSLTSSSTKPAFYYIKTLTATEYKAVKADSEGFKYFPVGLRTNMDESACTIYVANKFFNTATCSFVNDDYLTYSVAIADMPVVGATGTAKLSVTSEDNTPYTVTVSGATPSTINYTPTSASGDTKTFDLTVNSYSAGVGYKIVAVEGDDYSVYADCNGSEYRTLDIGAGNIYISSYESFSSLASMTLSLGHDTYSALGSIEFNVKEVTSDSKEVTIEAPNGTVATEHPNDGYIFKITLTNYDGRCKYYYSSTQNGTKTEVSVVDKTFTVSKAPSTIYLFAGIGSNYSGYTSVVRGRGATTVTQGTSNTFDTEYYLHTATNKAVSIKLSKDVTSSDLMYLFDSSQSGSATVQLLATGTATVTMASVE